MCEAELELRITSSPPSVILESVSDRSWNQRAPGGSDDAAAHLGAQRAQRTPPPHSHMLPDGYRVWQKETELP